MHGFAYKFLPLLLILGLSPLSLPTSLRAQEHIVPKRDLHETIRESQRKRAEDLRRIEAFFGSEDVQKVLETSALRPAQVQRAVPFLSDAELARLASQTEKIQRDISAGALNNQQLTYIVIALATAVVVILAS